MKGRADHPVALDREGIEIADVARREASHGERGLAGVAILPVPFTPILSGLKVTVDRPEQRRPLEALV